MEILEEVKDKVEVKEVNQRAVRFSTAPWFTPGLETIVIGLGGIGSYLAYYLGRQDAELHLFDFDIVESTNLGGQLFGTQSCTKTKVEATKELIDSFSANTKIYSYEEYKKDSISGAFVFVCPDNLEARKIAFNNWIEYTKKNPEEECLFIEASMSAENFMVHFVTKDRIEKYSKYLFSETKIEALPCNFKATSHCGAMCAGLMISGFNNFIANRNLKEDIRDVPYEISTQLASFTFNTVF